MFSSPSSLIVTRHTFSRPLTSHIQSILPTGIVTNADGKPNQEGILTPIPSSTALSEACFGAGSPLLKMDPKIEPRINEEFARKLKEVQEQAERDKQDAI